MKYPRKHQHILTDLCEAGQHKACPSVGDPYGDLSEFVFICTCDCHLWSQPRKKVRP